MFHGCNWRMFFNKIRFCVWRLEAEFLCVRDKWRRFCVWRLVADVLCLDISGGGSVFEDKWRMFSV